MTTPLPLFIVDAFTDVAFSGNPAAVVLLPAWRPEQWLQLVAREMNLSETAFLVPRADLPALGDVLERAVAKIGAERFSVDQGVAKVSLVGAGIRSHPEVVARMFRALADQGINIEMISTSSIRVSCVVRQDRADDAVRAIHGAFGIAEETAVRAEHTGQIPPVPRHDA